MWRRNIYSDHNEKPRIVRDLTLSELNFLCSRYWITDLNYVLVITVYVEEQIIHTTPSYGSFDKRIQLFITTDCKLQVAWSDPLNFEILGCITCQLQHLQSIHEIAYQTRVKCLRILFRLAIIAKRSLQHLQIKHKRYINKPRIICFQISTVRLQNSQYFIWSFYINSLQNNQKLEQKSISIARNKCCYPLPRF